MFARKLIVACALLVSLAGAVYPQSSTDTTTIPLIVDRGFPLQVALTEGLRFKENEAVHARIVEPVYSFDREVIPAGTEVEGRITGFRKAGKWKRISTMLSGDFTPLRTPQITFTTLVLHDGIRIPIETCVEPGLEKTVGLDGDTSQKALKNGLTSTVKESTGNRVKKFLWSMSPYHPRSLAAGTPLKAVLAQPLDFGVAVLEEGALDVVGSQLPADTIVSVRLITPLDSGTVKIGTSIEAQLIRPVFSSDHRLIFPVGSTLHGEVIDVAHAKSFHRNGRLAFTFTTIEPPALLMSRTMTPEEVEATLLSAGVNHDMKHLHINENSTKIVESKTRFIGPAWAFIKSGRALDAGSHSFDEALLGAYRSKFLKQVVGSESSFGLPASISGAMVPPIGIGFGMVGVARSVYSNFLGRGHNIVLPANTPMQIRLVNAVPQEEPAISQEEPAISQEEPAISQEEPAISQEEISLP